MKTQKHIAGLDSICVKIAQQTDDNDHTGAKLTIAKLCGFRDFIKVFEAIQALQDVEGCMPSDLSEYRRRKGIEMIQRVKDYFPAEFYERIYKSL